jgi:hypothetical protein
MKTLQDVALSFKQAAGRAIYPGISSSLVKFRTAPNSRAFKTGNLLTKFVTSPLNTPNNIAKKTINGFELTIEVGPDGAEYGKYVHYGTSKMGARPFAEMATQDDRFKAELDEFLGDEVDKVVQEFLGPMDSQWKDAGFSVS